MEISTIIWMFVWAWVNYACADNCVKTHEGFEVNPILYAVGSFAFGGIFTLIFLFGKLAFWNRKQKQIAELKKELNKED